MSTPFYVVDHKIDPYCPITPDGRIAARRTTPEPLRLTLSATAMPLEHHNQPVAKPDTGDVPPNTAPSGAGWLARLFRGLRHAPA